MEFLNRCLSDRVAVHCLVIASLNHGTPGSTLLQGGTQSYLQDLYRRVLASAELRRRLTTGKALYFLQCLTDECSRESFIRAAALPSFVS